jgi:mutator protein MutT
MKTYLVAAAIIRCNDKILIAKRLKGAHMGLKWEFPGGKIETGEDAGDCLRREIKEELDLDIGVGEELTVVEHQYEDRKILLHCHLCRYLGGQAKARGCQDFRWVYLGDLQGYDFADADRTIVRCLLGED